MGSTIAVIQARAGSSRLPRKILALIAGEPLLTWTIKATQAVEGIDRVIVATTTETEDDETAALAGQLAEVYRGSTFDVLDRVWRAVEGHGEQSLSGRRPTIPFRTPSWSPQVRTLREGRFDFVGNGGWPLGIAAEVAHAEALEAAAAEARDSAEREHVMPFIYARPERFRIGVLPPPSLPVHSRYTVDTAAHLELTRALAIRVPHGSPILLHELETIIRREPGLADLNQSVRQKEWREVDDRARHPRSERQPIAGSCLGRTPCYMIPG